MGNTWWTGWTLLAQDGGGPGGWIQILTLVVPIGLLFYFLLILPQRRERNQRETMLGALKKNDHIVTAGGIHGVVANVHREADEVTLKVDEATNTKLRVTLGSIARVIGNGSSSERKS